MGKKYLITGGSGFIGSHLVDYLINEKHTVVNIDNNSASFNSFFYDNDLARNIKESILNTQKIDHCFNGVDTIFHLAAMSRIQPSISNPNQCLEVNVGGTLNILNLAVKHNIKNIVFASSSSVYGNQNSTCIETMDLNPLNIYSKSKHICESILKEYSDMFKLNIVALRYFNVYGERQPDLGEYATVVSKFLKQKRDNHSLTIIGDGLQQRTFTHVDDLTNAHVLLSKSIPDGYSVYNICGDDNLSIKDLAYMISDNVIFLKERVGEARVTFGDSSKFKKDFHWTPQIKIKNWINQELNS